VLSSRYNSRSLYIEYLLEAHAGDSSGVVEELVVE